MLCIAIGAKCSVWHCSPTNLLACDDLFHDACCPITDFEPHDVSHALLVREIEGVSVVTCCEQTIVDDLDGVLRSHPLAHGGLGRVGEPRFAKLQRVKGKLANRLDDRLTLRKWKAHALELPDRSAESLALFGVGPGIVKRSPCCTDTFERY